MRKLIRIHQLLFGAVLSYRNRMMRTRGQRKKRRRKKDQLKLGPEPASRGGNPSQIVRLHFQGNSWQKRRFLLYNPMQSHPMMCQDSIVAAFWIEKYRDSPRTNYNTRSIKQCPRYVNIRSCRSDRATAVKIVQQLLFKASYSKFRCTSLRSRYGVRHLAQWFLQVEERCTGFKPQPGIKPSTAAFVLAWEPDESASSCFISSGRWSGLPPVRAEWYGKKTKSKSSKSIQLRPEAWVRHPVWLIVCHWGSNPVPFSEETSYS